MDKRTNGLAAAMREIAEERDNQLREAGAISAERLEELKAVLALELPVETALFVAARRRDESLSAAEPTLPAMVQLALTQQARSARSKAIPFGMLRQLVAWVNGTSFPGVYRAAAAAAVAMVVISAVMQLARSRSATTQSSKALPPTSFVNPSPAAFFNPAAHLTLRMNRLELASLDPSLLTINRALPDLEHFDRVLPLDLPIRRIRLDVEAVNTP